MATLPILDVSYFIKNYGNDETISEKFKNDVNIKAIGSELLSAFQEWGFVYVKGHGIPEDFMETLYANSRKFFFQKENEKLKVVLNNSDDAKKSYGYAPFKHETFDRSRPHDLKEAFNYLPWLSEEYQSNLPNDFVTSMDTMYSKCAVLTKGILRLLNVMLDIDDSAFLENVHSIPHHENLSTLRSLYYPPVDHVEESQYRCGEHSDFGTLTLLFQDDAGGLEVQSPSGKFIQATPIPGTLLLNAADLLERWTSGKIKSTRHRVQPPVDQTKARQSVAFFCAPNNDVLVSCLDGSNKYKPVYPLEYMMNEMKKIY